MLAAVADRDGEACEARTTLGVAELGSSVMFPSASQGRVEGQSAVVAAALVSAKQPGEVKAVAANRSPIRT